MRSLIIAIVVVLVAIGGWFVAWKSMMAADVAHVEASIKHRYEAIKAVSPHTTFKVDGVYATGFPFKFRVAVHRPTLTQIWGGETYAISFEKIELDVASDNQSLYRFKSPREFDAMYAKDGSAPEQYRIALSDAARISLQSDAPGGPLTRYAAQLPQKLVLDVTLNGQTKQIGFDFPFALPMPIFTTIPADASRPLQIFVGMLREAMVFQH